ncbi:MAG: hypothetical protein OEX00_05985 [Gammaproteobacteria bacterium]|nr:hypothetical protein [Gammaproteobacteria bacterium]
MEKGAAGKRREKGAGKKVPWKKVPWKKVPEGLIFNQPLSLAFLVTFDLI